MTRAPRRRAAARLCATLLLAWPAAGWATTTSDRFRWALDELQASPASCPDGLDAYGVAAEAKCFSVDAEFRTVRRAVDRRFERPNWPLADWTREGSYRARVVPGASEVFMVLFEPERGTLAVVPQRPCPSDPGVHVAEGDAFEQPRPIKKEPLDLPDDVIAARLPGAVALRLLIAEDGTVRDVCLLHVEPRRYGFEEVVKQAVLRWRYEPARLDGKPVPVYWIVGFSWSAQWRP